MGEVFADDAELSVTPVDVISGELRVLTEILCVLHTVRTSAIGRIEPWHTDTVPNMECAYIGADRVYGSDDLMTGNQWQFREREITFDTMQVCMTNSAGANANANFVGRRSRVGQIDEA